MTPPGDMDRAWPWVRYFLEHHLSVHRGARANTVASYRITFRQLRRYLCERMGEWKTRELSLRDLEPALILDFLSWLQSGQRKVGTATRNLRLAALRSFFRCLELYCSVDERRRWERLRQLPQKRAPRPHTDHFEVHELNVVFSQINVNSSEGLRDLTLLAMLYNTGARASEAAGLKCGALALVDNPSVRFDGKGGRQRRTALWPSIVALLKRYLGARLCSKASPVFVNQRGGALTRHGIGRRVAHYIELAARSLPTLSSKKLTTHSFRHTTAVHLLESGADMHAIKAWLGHCSTRSTDHYLDLNIRAQRDLLARFSPPSRLLELTELPTDPSDWLDSL